VGAAVKLLRLLAAWLTFAWVDAAVKLLRPLATWSWGFVVLTVLAWVPPVGAEGFGEISVLGLWGSEPGIRM
jgi:hypothetical protein